MRFIHLLFSSVTFAGTLSKHALALTKFDGSRKEPMQRPSNTIENFRLRIQPSTNGGGSMIY